MLPEMVVRLVDFTFRPVSAGPGAIQPGLDVILIRSVVQHPTDFNDPETVAVL